ncbi:MAG: DUF3576 domain-containing protein [Rhodobacteraceae bacterium]|nr:DUF3576 domain-containing protein [Paracoccaceae bacterium]
MNSVCGGRAGAVLLMLLALAACGGGNPFRNEMDQDTRDALVADGTLPDPNAPSILDLLRPGDDPNTAVAVNLYLWNAALEVLEFMPVEMADPFSGVIVFGYGRVPGENRTYRATVHVSDPALDARSLRVAVMGPGGPVSQEEARQIEDAILTRARQLRVRDAAL